MGRYFFIMLISLMLASGHVMSFSISSRHERSTDLAEALAILQRQRRRAVADYRGSDRLLNDGGFDLEEDGDWYRPAHFRGDRLRNDIDTDYESNGRFVDFESPLEYRLPIDNNQLHAELTVEPSKQELEDIFDSDDVEVNASHPKLFADSLPEKKKKEEMISVKGDGKIVQKKSLSTDVAEAVVATAAKDGDANDGLSLDTLTKEEFHALMKAVDKLQKQAVKFSEKTVETPEAKVTTVEALEKNGEPKSLTIVQPASEEELKSVFDGEETPVVKETEVVVEKDPNARLEKITEKEVVSNVSPKKAKALKEKELDLINEIASELEDNIAAEAVKEAAESLERSDSRAIAGIERDWLTSAPQKRTMKRSAGFLPPPAKDVVINDLTNDANANNNGVIEDLDTSVVPSRLEPFVAKILELQDEVDNLKIVSRLEDLENDVLTDALNEATLAQKEGSVTDMEFESLQQAIRIEEALQKLKNSEGATRFTGNLKKRGEPWRRKRDPDVDNDNDVIIEEKIPPYPVIIPSSADSRPSVDDLERILSQSDVREENEPDTEVASFFMSNADECPAVQEYSTNCELADLYSLPVDFEARSLCNLHEMCYACGNSLQVGQDQCDLVYRAAASALCRGKQNCVLESEIFLRTMKLKTRYIPHSQPLCRSTCVAEFLGML